MAVVSGGRVQGLSATSAAPTLPCKIGAQSMHTRVGFDTPNLGIALLWAEQSPQAMRPQCRQWCLPQQAGTGPSLGASCGVEVGRRDGCELPRGGSLAKTA